MTFKVGEMVSSRLKDRMLERVDGKPGTKMIAFSKGSVGRIVHVRKVGRVGSWRQGHVYLVKFVGGVVELASNALESGAEIDDIKLLPEASDIADPNLKVKEAPLEKEPDY